MVIRMDINEVKSGLSYNEKKLLLALDKNGGHGSPQQMIDAGDFSLEVEIMGSASWLESKGLAKITESSEKFFELTDPESLRNGLPERIALTLLNAHNGTMTIPQLASEMGNGEDNIAVGWLMRKKLVTMQQVEGEKALVLTESGKKAVSSVMPDEELISRMLKGPVAEKDADKGIIKDLKLSLIHI